MPGETLHEFRAAYDELLLRFPNLLLHPLWILPNTSYDDDREALGLVTIRPDPTVDYEGVFEHRTLSREDNRAGLRLLLADDILIGTGYARATVRGLAHWAGLKPTAVLDAFIALLDVRADELAQALNEAFREITSECYFHRRLRSAVRSALYADIDRARKLLIDLVDHLIDEPDVRAACRELATYDTALLPRADAAANPNTGPPNAGTADSHLDAFYDVHSAAQALLSPNPPPAPTAPEPVRLLLRHPSGFTRHRGDPIDLSLRWRGRVVEVHPLAAWPTR